MNKTAGTGYDILMRLVGARELIDLMGRLDDDQESAELLSKSVRLLGKKFDIDGQEEAALNRLANMVRDGQHWDGALLRNNIFKIANSLGIKLPSGMFASTKQATLLPKLPGDPIRVLRMFTVEGLRKKKVRLDEGAEGTFVKMEVVGMPSAALLDQMGMGAYSTPRYIATFPAGPVYLEASDFQFKYVERPTGERNLLKAPGARATPEEKQERRQEIQNLHRVEQRYAMNPQDRLAELRQQRTSKLMSRQEAILKKYLADAGSRAVSDFDDLPANVRSALEAVKDQETLWSDVNRWLDDNNNPHLRGASQGEQAMSLRQQIQRIAAQHPETRVHLIPLLRKYAEDGSVVACTCPDGGKWAMENEHLADGDELEAGRSWGKGKKSPHDAWRPYAEGKPKGHELGVPAGTNGSPQRKIYNEEYRKEVCPKHPTTCGAPWLKKK